MAKAKKKAPTKRNGYAKSLSLPVFKPVVVPDAKKKAQAKSRQRQRARLKKLHPKGDW